MDDMLTQLFGIGWQNLVLLPPEDETTGDLLGKLFGLFNAAIGGILVGIFFIIGSQAIADTAEQGSIMGDKKPSWFLIRTITAGALIMPLVKGFSLLQILILSLVVNFSVLLANTMATETMIYLLKGHNPFTDPLVQKVDGVAEQMLMTSVCEIYFNEIEYTPDQGGSFGRDAIQRTLVTNYEDNWITDDALSLELSYNGIRETGLGADACGRYVVRCQDTSEETKNMCTSQMDALEKLKEGTDGIARAILDDRPLPEKQLAIVKLDYERRMRDAIRTRVASENGGVEGQEIRDKLVQQVADKGFIYLGQWYMTLTSLNQKISNFAKPNISTKPIDLSTAIDYDLGVAAHLNRAAMYVDKKSVSVPISEGLGDRVTETERRMAGLADDDFGGYFEFLNNDRPLNFFGVNMVEQFGIADDPIIGLQRMGDFFITTATGSAILGTVAGTVGPSGKMKLLERVFGSKGADRMTGKNGSNFDFSGTAAGAAGLLSGAMFVLFLCGLVLLYYVPLIPFILWTFGVVAYLIIIIESLIAAPLWAASHALPRGDGFVSDQARQGYSLLLNLAIRPPIMVLGLMAGGVLMLIVTPFVIKSFEIYAVALVTNRMEVTGFITYVILTVVLVLFVVGVIQKTHSLIWEAGDRVIQWVTSTGRSTNDISDERNLALMVGQAKSSTGEVVGKGSAAANAARAAKQTSQAKTATDNQKLN